MAIRGKFTCTSIELRENWKHPGKQSHTVRLSAVSDDGTPESQRFAAATPAGSVEITVDNPDAQVFTPGKDYFVDLTPAD